MRPAQQRERVGFLRATFGIAICRACDLISLNRSTYYVKSTAHPFNAMLRERIKEIASARVRYGYRRIGVLLRRDGLHVNDKRVFRLYRLEGLSLRAKMPHRRRAAVARSARVVAEKRNQIWSMDFMHDRLADGRAYRLLTIVDIFTRECVALDVAPRFCSDDVAKVLKRVCTERGTPEMIRCDNVLKAFVKASEGKRELRAVQGAFDLTTSAMNRCAHHSDTRSHRRASTVLKTASVVPRREIRPLSTRSQAPQRPVAKGFSRLAQLRIGGGNRFRF